MGFPTIESHPRSTLSDDEFDRVGASVTYPPRTACRWFGAGKLPVPAEWVGGLIMVGDLAGARPRPSGKTANARVSPAERQPDLDRQVARVTAWATSNRHAVDQVVTEVGSALNGKRGKFLGILGDPGITTIIVERRGRFARFESEYLEAALDTEQRRLVVVDDTGLPDNLVRDTTEPMTSLCARLYGRPLAASDGAGIEPGYRGGTPSRGAA